MTAVPEDKIEEAVKSMVDAVACLDRYRQITSRHGVADLMLFEDLQSREGDDLTFPSTTDAMAHVLREGLSTVESSIFGDENIMQFDYDEMSTFLSDNNLIVTEEEED